MVNISLSIDYQTIQNLDPKCAIYFLTDGQGYNLETAGMQIVGYHGHTQETIQITSTHNSIVTEIY